MQAVLSPLCPRGLSAQRVELKPDGACALSDAESPNADWWPHPLCCKCNACLSSACWPGGPACARKT
eukprot:3779255-Amphidinium_carterae.1